MAALKPLNREDFSAVFGMGEHKLKIYSEPFISDIRQYVTNRNE
jgi:superfamily II DNA helicase RecQ